MEPPCGGVILQRWRVKVHMQTIVSELDFCVFFTAGPAVTQPQQIHWITLTIPFWHRLEQVLKWPERPPCERCQDARGLPWVWEDVTQTAAAMLPKAPALLTQALRCG